MDIVYEDNHLIIVNKSAGELSQSDHTGDSSLVDKVKNYIKTKYKKPGNVYLGLVNRLDRPTSGLVIFSKTHAKHPNFSNFLTSFNNWLASDLSAPLTL